MGTRLRKIVRVMGNEEDKHDASLTSVTAMWLRGVPIAFLLLGVIVLVRSVEVGLPRLADALGLSTGSRVAFSIGIFVTALWLFPIMAWGFAVTIHSKVDRWKSDSPKDDGNRN